VFSAFGVSTVGATENTNSDFSEEQQSQEIQISSSIEYQLDNVQPNATNWKDVIFKGTPVAWFIDGTIQYFTGSAPSEWVSMGLQPIEDAIVGYLSTPLYSQAIVDAQGRVSARECVTYPCPIDPHSEDDEDEEFIIK
jgi:hypothetical protein